MTNKLKAYSATPASNNAASPNGWPEGMAPSGLNNSDREFAARVREWYADPAWIDYGDTINSSTSTTVSIAGDVTAQYVVNRAIRAGQSDSAIGYVTAAVYSAPNTSITCAGLDLTSVSQIELGAVKNTLPLPGGMPVRVRRFTNGTQADVSATIIPVDNTKPQISEGTEIMTGTFTCADKNSTIRVKAHIPVFDLSVANVIAAAVFVNGGSNAIGASLLTLAPLYGGVINIDTEYSPGTTSAQTFSVRVGPNSVAGQQLVNYTDAGFGSLSVSVLTLEEIRAQA